jgi:hypothetical protein
MGGWVGFVCVADKLGTCFEEGRGVAVDMGRALALYESAAAAAHPHAMWRLARCHRFGRGTPIDRARAIALYERAADGGVVEARQEMERLLELQQASSDELKNNAAQALAPAAPEAAGANAVTHHAPHHAPVLVPAPAPARNAGGGGGGAGAVAWRCGSCTLQNEAAARDCIACGLPRH